MSFTWTKMSLRPMATEILDRSQSYLRIFTEPVEIDYTLPKYNAILKKVEEGKNGVVTVTEDYSSLDRAIKDRKVSVFNSYEKRKALARMRTQQTITQEAFDAMSVDELNFLVDEKKAKDMASQYKQITPNQIWVEEFPDEDPIVSNTVDNFRNTMGSTAKALENLYQSNKKKEEKGWMRGLLGKIFKKSPESKEKEEETPDEDPKEEKPKVYKLDVIKFFDLVKLTTQKEVDDYYGRIGSYLAALKDAKEMGQTALVDKWLARLFTVKYESILRSKGFEKRITEAQMVNFIKLSEKGISLCYIKNFSRPIPKEVREKKLEADSLHVFDNYVVLYYDPNGKVYKETKDEKEEERRKKADPILFGIMADSRCLYYIADWVDDYCDLTLDKFLEVSGILENNIKISEKYEI